MHTTRRRPSKTVRSPKGGHMRQGPQQYNMSLRLGGRENGQGWTLEPWSDGRLPHCCSPTQPGQMVPCPKGIAKWVTGAEGGKIVRHKRRKGTEKDAPFLPGQKGRIWLGCNACMAGRIDYSNYKMGSQPWRSTCYWPTGWHTAQIHLCAIMWKNIHCTGIPMERETCMHIAFHSPSPLRLTHQSHPY